MIADGVVPVALALGTGLLAEGGPRLVRRAAALERAPRLALVLWQSLAAATVAGTLLTGAALLLPRLPAPGSHHDPIAGTVDLLQHAYSTPLPAVAGLAGLTVVVGTVVRVLLAGLLVTVRTRRQRRAHREALALVAERRGGAVVVPHDVPAAYCVPGPGDVLVVTTAAVAALGPAPLEAVLAHERCHLRGRHHVLLAAADVLATALPWARSLREGRRATERLVELCADDAARRAVGREAVVEALVVLAGASAPRGALAAGGDVLRRVERLLDAPPPLEPGRRALAITAALVTPLLPFTVAAAPVLAAVAVR